jgi:sec-independent protein translocase protein TatB
VFDIGFSELMVIGVVALVVIGPERLPRVARTAGHLFGRMQRYVNDVKADINREIEMSELKDLKKTVEEASSSIEQSMSSHINEISSEVRKTEEEFNRLQNPMLHFGLAGAATGTTIAEPDATAPTSTEPVRKSELSDDESPQLELGLSAHDKAMLASPQDRGRDATT